MCQGRTIKKEKCKNKTEPFCHLHEPKEFVHPISVIHLTTSTKNKIKRRLQKPVSKTDGPGFIYVYTLPEDGQYFKIGRTERSVEQRIKEWKGAILKKNYPVAYQKKTERLIHLYLDHCRVYRYQIAKGKICTIWKSNGEPVTDYDATLKEKHKLSVLTKQVEWFNCPWEEIDTIISSVINHTTP